MQSGTLSIDSRVDLNLFKNNHVVVLDDICDTGKTLVQLINII
jgi:hypoxanthine phosphoribosyltransferase